MKWKGLLPSGMKSRKSGVCPRLFDTRNQACGSSFIQYKVVQLESWSSSVRYEESCMQYFIRPVRSRARRDCPRLSGTRYQASETTSVRIEVARGEFVHVCPVQGIKQVGLRLFDAKSCKRIACPRSSGTRSKAGRTSSIRYKYKVSSKWVFVRSMRSRTKG